MTLFDEMFHKSCTPCTQSTPKFTNNKIHETLQLFDLKWICVNDHHIYREFSFKHYNDALLFTTYIAQCAEQQQHHPDILLRWGVVTVTLSTHSIDGLSENDFILADICNKAIGFKTITCQVKGNVQGVFFRKFIQEKALDIGVKGWVTNNIDGTVTTCFSGELFRCYSMVNACKQGSPMSYVQSVVYKESPKEEFKEFDIL